jgi:hypothetical protein
LCVSRGPCGEQVTSLGHVQGPGLEYFSVDGALPATEGHYVTLSNLCGAAVMFSTSISLLKGLLRKLRDKLGCQSNDSVLGIRIMLNELDECSLNEGMN